MARLSDFVSSIAVYARRRLHVPVVTALLVGLLVIVGVWSLALPRLTRQKAICDGCQCCYCDERRNGQCIVNGQPSACIGCVGACAYNDQQPWLPGSCSDGGRGGCGADVVWCRDSDCGPGPVATKNPPTATPQPRPTPVVPPTCPALGEVREWTNLIPPKIGSPEYRPPYHVVIEQDPDKAGFEIHLTFDGGRYEYKTQRLEQWCGPESAG